MSNSSALDKRPPTLLDTDVLVVGGGAAGVAAAQTARNGVTKAEHVRSELVRQGALIAAPQPERTLS